MANYAVDDWVGDPDTLTNAVAALETRLETLADSKTIRLITVVKRGQDSYSGVLITDA